MKSLILPLIVAAPLVTSCAAMHDDARRDAVLVDVFKIITATVQILDTVAQ